MSTHNIFLWRNKKNITGISPLIWSYVEYQEKSIWTGKAGLNSGVVLFSSDLNS